MSYSEYSDYSEEDLRREKTYQEWRRSRPICDECGEHITDDTYWEIDGNIYCPECAEELFRKVFMD